MQRSRIFRLARLLVILEVLWLLVANVALSTGLAAALINRKPEKFSIHWEGARSWFPVRVQARDLVYLQHTRNMEIEIRAPEASASFRILPLLGGRGVFDDVEVHDVTAALVHDPTAAPDTDDRGPGFRWGFEDVTAHGIERFSFDDVAITGGAPVVSGSMGIQVRGPMEFRDVVGAWPDAHIEVAGVVVADSISLAFRGGVTPFHPGHDKGRALLEKISGTLDIDGESRDLRPLHLLLTGVDWIERLDGSGDVEVHMILDEGRLQPGTDVDIDAWALDLWFLGFAAHGSGRVDVVVSESQGTRRGRMDVLFEDFDFRRQGSKEPLATGSGFTFTARARDLGFSEEIEDLDLTLDIPKSVVPDVSLLAAGLPPGLGIQLTGGRAELSGHLESHGLDAEAEGVLQIDGTGLEGRYRDMDFAVDLAFATRVAGRNLDAFDIRLDGTEVRLFNGAFDGEEDVEDGWWMTIAIPEGSTNLRPPAKVEARLDLSMRDTRAIIAAFAEVNRWIRYFDGFLTVRDVAGNASLGIDGSRFSLRDVSLTGDRLEMLAELEFRNDHSEGIFWGKLGPFSLAMERMGDENDFKLLNDREWYAEKHAAHWEGR
jgi:hypothetical protein